MDELPCTPPSESQRALYSVLESRIQEEPLKGMVGPDCVTGSNLPSHSDVHTSCLTGLRIQVRFQRAEVFFLVDSIDYLWGCHRSKVPPTVWVVKVYTLIDNNHRSRTEGDRQWHLLYKKGYIKNVSYWLLPHHSLNKRQEIICLQLHINIFLFLVFITMEMHTIKLGIND